MGTRRYFATTSKGLEQVLLAEIRGLGGSDAAVSTGGVSFAGDDALCFRANLWLRTAGRVLLHLADFPAATPEALYAGARAVPWSDLFPAGSTFAIDATARDSRLGHAHFVELKVKDAVADSFREKVGSRPSVELRTPDVRIAARIHRDLCTLSIDTSGESLNRRGYREDPSPAPLRETVAAGIVLLAGWDGRVPLADPACGSGTIPVEAALIAANVAPGLLRRAFGFERLAGFDRRLWHAVRDEARAREKRNGAAPIAGSDISADAVRSARRNAGRAGVAGRIAFAEADIRDFSPGDGPGIIVCNPPYGVRSPGAPGIEPFYRAMGEAFKKRCKGWTAYVLSGDPEATRHIGLKASRRFPVMNGAIDCRLLRYDLY